MKEIKLILSDEVYSELKNDFIVKGVTGNLYSITDEFINKLLKHIENGATELALDFNKGKKRRKI